MEAPPPPQFSLPPPPGGPPPPPPGGPPPPGAPPQPGPWPPPRPPARSSTGKIVGIVAGVLAGLLVLCGGVVTVGFIVVDRAGVFDDQAGDLPSPAAPPASGPVDWLLIERDVPAVDDLWWQLADEFSIANDAEVQVDRMPRDAYRELLASRLESGDPPEIFDTAGGYELRRQVERGLVRDLTDELADVIATLPPSTLAPYTIDGRVYGLPYTASVTGIWYNRALFAAAGLDPDTPPATWSEFLAAVETLKGADIIPVAIAGLDTWTVLFWYGYLAARVAGVDAFEAASQERSLSADPAYERAAVLLEEFIGDEPFQPGFQSATWAGPGGPTELMGTGQAAMELMGSWAPDVYQGLGGGELGDDLGWFPFPAVEGGLGAAGDLYGGAEGFAVGANAPGTAIEFLRFLFSDATYQRITDANPGVLPVRTGPEPPADPLLARQLAAIEAAPGMQLYLDTALPAEASGELISGLGDLLAGSATPAELVARTTDAWQLVTD